MFHARIVDGQLTATEVLTPAACDGHSNGAPFRVSGDSHRPAVTLKKIPSHMAANDVKRERILNKIVLMTCNLFD